MSQNNQGTKPKFPSKDWFGVSKNRNMFIGICCAVVILVIIGILGASGVFGDLSGSDTDGGDTNGGNQPPAIELPAGLSVVEINDGAAYEISACDVSTTGTMEIPSTYNEKPIISIGKNAFLDCVQLTKIVIPNSITRIGDNAFRGCTKIKESDITVPASVISIGKDAFYNTALWNNTTNGTFVIVHEWIVGFKGNLTEYIFYREGNIGFFNNTVGISDSALSMLLGIKTLSTKDSAVYIGKNAFYACSTMESAIIGKKVKYIDKFAFSGCFRMTSITITNSETIIANDAFFGCSQLADIYFAGSESQWAAINNDVEIPAGATIHYNYVA